MPSRSTVSMRHVPAVRRADLAPLLASTEYGLSLGSLRAQPHAG